MLYHKSDIPGTHLCNKMNMMSTTTDKENANMITGLRELKVVKSSTSTQMRLLVNICGNMNI